MDKSHYYVFDAEEGGIFGGNMFNSVANFLFGIYKGITKLVITIVVFCYKVQIFQLFKDLLVDIMYPLKVTLYDQFLGLGIAITLITLYVIYSTGQSAGFLQGILKFFLVLFCGYIFLNNPSIVLDETDQVINEFNTGIINSSFQVVYGTKNDATMLAALSDQMWDQYVDLPWTMMEFGTVNPGVAKEELLALDPGSKERKAKAKSLASTYRTFKKDNAWERIPNVFLFSIIAVACMMLDTLLAAVNIGFDGAVLLLAIYAPVVFTLSLIPFYGPKTIEAWIRNIVTFLVLRVVVVVVLTVKFVLNAYFYTKAEAYGVLGVIIIQLFIYMALYLNRKKLLNMVDSARFGHRGINRAIDQSSDPVGQAKRDYQGLQDARGSMQRFTRRVGWGSEPAYAGVDGNYSERRGGSGRESDANEPAQSHATYGRSRDKDTAREYLTQRFQHERSAAESRAQYTHDRTGRRQEPEYSDFVAEHMHIDRMGGEMFSRAEINETIQELNHIRSMGGSEGDLFRQIQEDQKYSLNAEAPERVSVNLAKSVNLQVEEQAKVFLSRQYDLHKTTADTRARETAAATRKTVLPEYDGFTETVQDRMRKGHNQFSKEEITSASERIKSLKASGIEMEQYLKTMPVEDMSGISERFKNKSEKIYDISSIQRPENTINSTSDAYGGEINRRLSDQNERMRNLESKLSGSGKSLRQEMEERSEIEQVHSRLDTIAEKTESRVKLDDTEIDRIAQNMRTVKSRGEKQ